MSVAWLRPRGWLSSLYHITTLNVLSWAVDVILRFTSYHWDTFLPSEARKCSRAP